MQSTIGYILEGKFFKEVALCQLTHCKEYQREEKSQEVVAGISGRKV